MAVLQTPWYGKAVEALKLNGKGERTQEAYARHVRKLIEFFNGMAPDQITEEELKRYLIHRQDINKWQPNTMRICYSAIKSFYLHVVQRGWHLLKVIKAPTEKTTSFCSVTGGSQRHSEQGCDFLPGSGPGLQSWTDIP